MLILTFYYAFKSYDIIVYHLLSIVSTITKCFDLNVSSWPPELHSYLRYITCADPESFSSEGAQL